MSLFYCKSNGIDGVFLRDYEFLEIRRMKDKKLWSTSKNAHETESYNII